MINYIHSTYSLSKPLGKKDFSRKLSLTAASTLFVSGYFWILSLTYPAITILPALFLMAVLAGNFTAAFLITKRLRTLDDNNKSEFIVFVPFFGIVYALPAVIELSGSKLPVETAAVSVSGIRRAA